jgi:hypothetical protein
MAFFESRYFEMDFLTASKTSFIGDISGEDGLIRPDACQGRLIEGFILLKSGK